MSSQKQTTPLTEAQRILGNAVPKAAEILVQMLTAKDEKLRLKAAAAILNRAGITEADRIYHGYANQVIGGEQKDL